MMTTAILKTLLLLALSSALISGCGTSQTHSYPREQQIGLSTAQLQQHGLALITPASVSGRDQDRQVLASMFSDQMKLLRPDVPLKNLPETLSAINVQGLTADYRQMNEDYANIGIFNRQTLQAISQASGHRYLAQLKLSHFQQDSRSRLSFLGLRLLTTKTGEIRLFLQIWDSETGEIAWEGSEELIMAEERAQEKIITFSSMVEEASRTLIELLP